MFNIRRLWIVPTLLAAGGAPFLVSNTPRMSQQVQNWMGDSDSGLADQATSFNPAAFDPDLATPVTGQPVQDFRDLLRFDVTPAWVQQRWSRVTTVTAESDLRGYRVAVVTGTAQNDLSGSLTYYFDQYERLQRIGLHGHTGDATRLISMANQTYGLRREPSLAAGIFVRRWNSVPISVLSVEQAPIVRSTAPHAQRTVRLELNRGELVYGLSPEFQEIVHRHSLRPW